MSASRPATERAGPSTLARAADARDASAVALVDASWSMKTWRGMECMMARHLLAATVFTLGLLAAAFGQPATKVYRVGYLGYTASNTPEDDRLVAAFRQRLGELGFVEGANLVIEWRY